MKKESFKGILCLLAGITGTILIFGCMFKALHWPGASYLLYFCSPLLLSLIMICLSCYTAAFGALKSSEKPSAKHLLNAEIIAFIAMAVLVIAIMFKILHWPGGSQMLLVACSTLAFVSLMAGFFGCKLLNE